MSPSPTVERLSRIARFFTIQTGISPLRATLILLALVSTLQTATLAQTRPWISAYYAGWMWGRCQPEEVDYTAVTHVMHFSLGVNSNGTLDDQVNGLGASTSSRLIPLVHAAGKKVLVTVGGWWTESQFLGATSPANMNTFITNLVNFVKNRGYDGLDVDWEPLWDVARFREFIPKLHAALKAANPNYLLTAATTTESVYGELHQYFDQINIMTYDLSGAWPGWVTWHNSPTYDGGYRFPSTNGLVPSADGNINKLINSGVPKEKLGIGLDFYGYVWSGGSGTPTGGATAPRQGWSTAPTIQPNIPYSDLRKQYPNAQEVWDADAGAAYLSIDESGSANDKFISFDNVQTAFAKVDYVRKKGIGGMIVWELGGGYERGNQVPDALLQAVKSAVGGETLPVDTTSGPGVIIPEGFVLGQNYPNPFNPLTRIPYDVSVRSQITLTVFDILGREVATLVNEFKEAGSYVVDFDAARLPSGIYVYTLTTGTAKATKKMMLVR